MSVLKCEMCGADLVKSTEENIFICPYCGSRQTLLLTADDADFGTANLSDAEIADNLLKRVFVFLEYGEWDSAVKYANRVLDVNAENPKAYLGLLLAEHRVHKKEDLKNSFIPFKNDGNYKKLIKYCDENLARELEDYSDKINDNILMKQKKSVYLKGINYLENANSPDDFKKAIECFREIPEYLDSGEKIEECLNKEKECIEMSRLFLKEKSKQTMYVTRHPISAGFNHSVALKKDGTVVAAGGNYDGECDLSDWSEIISVSAGFDCSVGLKTDGSVVANGENNYGECDVESWTDIISVSTGLHLTAGLKSDGTLVSAGANPELQKEISAWKNIVQVAVSNEHIVGLKNDGTVLAAGDNKDGRCEVHNWSNIVAIAVGPYHTVGLKSDGCVLTAGKMTDLYKLSEWEDVIAVSAGDNHTVGLKYDGTVISAGDNSKNQCDVASWENIVTISAGANHTLALKSDGTVLATGSNRYGQCNVYNFSDILKTPKSKFASEIYNKAEKDEKQKISWQKQGLCIYCGGKLKGFFNKKCAVCGKENR